MYYKIDSDPKELDNKILKNMEKAISQSFPIKGNFYTLNANNIHAESSNVSLNDVKEAILSGKSVFNTIKGDLELIRNSDGKVIDKKTNAVISRVPKFTQKETFIVDGNSYVVPNQQRLKPGAYLFKRKNGEIVTIFNTSSNRQFKLSLDPSNGIFYFNIGSSKVPAISILNAIGVPHQQIIKTIGEKLYQVNQKKSNQNDLEKFLKKSYRLPDEIKNASTEEKIKYLFSNMKVDDDVTKRNFGVKSTSIDGNLILSAMGKLLDANAGKEVDIDQKNNLANRKILNAIHLMPEYFNKNFKKEAFKIKLKLNKPNVSKIEDVFSPSGVTEIAKQFLTTSKISRMPEEYNPVQIHMASKLLTPMGEGGIETDRALTEDDKAIHPSQLGFIDPIVSPEGAKTGVTLAVTGNAYISDDGEPAVKVINTKTGKKEIIPVKELWDKKVAFPTT